MDRDSKLMVSVERIMSQIQALEELEAKEAGFGETDDSKLAIAKLIRKMRVHISHNMNSVSEHGSLPDSALRMSE